MKKKDEGSKRGIIDALDLAGDNGGKAENSEYEMPRRTGEAGWLTYRGNQRRDAMQPGDGSEEELSALLQGMAVDTEKNIKVIPEEKKGREGAIHPEQTAHKKRTFDEADDEGNTDALNDSGIAEYVTAEDDGGSKKRKVDIDKPEESREDDGGMQEAPEEDEEDEEDEEGDGGIQEVQAAAMEDAPEAVEDSDDEQEPMDGVALGGLPTGVVPIGVQEGMQAEPMEEAPEAVEGSDDEQQNMDGVASPDVEFVELVELLASQPTGGASSGGRGGDSALGGSVTLGDVPEEVGSMDMNGSASGGYNSLVVDEELAALLGLSLLRY